MSKDLFGGGLIDDDAWLGFLADRHRNTGWRFSSIDVDPFGSGRIKAIFKHVVEGVEDFRRIQAFDLNSLTSLANMQFDNMREGIPRSEIEAAQRGVERFDAGRYQAYWRNVPGAGYKAALAEVARPQRENAAAFEQRLSMALAAD